MKLKNWMKIAKVKAGDMAKFLHIERTYFHKIVSGKRKPSLQILSRIKFLTFGKVETFKDLIGEDHGEEEKITEEN